MEAGLLHHYVLQIERISVARTALRFERFALPIFADCYCFLSYFDDNPAYAEQSIAATQKALELDPKLAEAHVSRGLALSTFSTEYAEAEIEFETAMELNPELFEAYYLYAHACRTQGKMTLLGQIKSVACWKRSQIFRYSQFRQVSTGERQYSIFTFPDIYRGDLIKLDKV